MMFTCYEFKKRSELANWCDVRGIKYIRMPRCVFIPHILCINIPTAEKKNVERDMFTGRGTHTALFHFAAWFTLVDE